MFGTDQYEQMRSVGVASAEAGLALMGQFAERIQTSLERQTAVGFELISTQLEGVRALTEVKDAQDIERWRETYVVSAVDAMTSALTEQLDASRTLRRESAAALRSHFAEMADQSLQMLERASGATPAVRPMIDSLRAAMAAGVEAFDQVDSLIATTPSGSGESVKEDPAKTARPAARRKAA